MGPHPLLNTIRATNPDGQSNLHGRMLGGGFINFSDPEGIAHFEGPLENAINSGYRVWQWQAADWGQGWMQVHGWMDIVTDTEDEIDEANDIISPTNNGRPDTDKLLGILETPAWVDEPGEDPKPILSSISFEDHDRMTSTLKDYLEELMGALRMAPELVITSSQGYFHLDNWRVDDIDDGDAWILAGDEVSSPAVKPDRVYLLGSTLLQVTVKSTK
jgi:hypothetical protein